MSRSAPHRPTAARAASPTRPSAFAPPPCWRPHALARAAASLLLAASPLVVQGQQAALPSGLQVVRGQASVATQGAQMTVRNSAGAILNWKSFDIGAASSVHFDQASAASKVLNRVTGNDPSAIFGSLTSNGQVWLLNPNGVLFGRDARIDVAGLVASTLRLNDSDFLAGRYRFDALAGDAAGVRNEGALRSSFGGQIVLLGDHVTNAGSIDAPGGSVALAASRRVELVDTGLPNLAVRVDVPAGEVLNLGRLAAAGGKVDVYGGIVNQRGLVAADTLGVDAQGRVTLRAADTLLLGEASRTQAVGSAEGSRGGQVDLLGPQVGAVGRAEVDVSGSAGGGSIRLGGGYQGKDAEVPNARAVFVGGDATLRADALAQGDGGRVIVWADEGTRFAGQISARGAGAGGHGGFAEVSAKGTLEYTGRADLAAPGGAMGTLLLDPQFIIVGDSNPNIDGLGNDLSTPTINFNDFSGTSAITSGAVNTQLAAANVTLQAQIDITVAAGITPINGPNALTLQAGRDIVINSNITANGGITLSANDPVPAAFALGKVQLNANLDAGAGTLTITNNGASGGIHTLAGNLKAATLAITGDLQLNSSSTWTLNGGVSTVPGFITGSGALTKAGPGTLVLTGASNFDGGTDITAGTLRVDGVSANAGSGTITIRSGATLDITNNANVNNDVAAENAATITGSSGTGFLMAAGALTLANGATLIIGGPGGQLSVDRVIPEVPGGTNESVQVAGIVYINAANTYAGGTTFTGSGQAQLFGSGAELGTGTITLPSGAILIVDSGATVSNPITLNGGNIFNFNGVGTVAGPVTLSGGPTFLSTTGAGLVVSGNLSGNSSLSIQEGPVTLSGTNTYTGPTFIGGISAANLTVAGANALPAAGAVVVANQGTLSLANNITTGALTVSTGGLVDLSSHVLTIDHDGSSTSAVTGNITGVGSIVKAGVGILGFDGSSTYTGGTTIAAGTLAASGAAAAIGTGAINVGTATLQVDNGASVGNAITVGGGTLGNAAGTGRITGNVSLGAPSTLSSTGALLVIDGAMAGTSGGITKTGSGNVILAGANTYNGTTTISAGTLGIGTGGGTTGTLGNGNVVNNATLAFNRSNAMTVSNVISGTGAVSQGGTGTTTLTAANTYTGATNISAGTLATGGANALPDASTVNLVGGTLQLGGNDTVASLFMNVGTATLGGASTLTAATYNLGGNATVNANLGTGTVNAAGNVSLQGTSAAATVNVNGGTLTLGAANRLADTAAVTLASGATMALGSFSDTVGSFTLNGTGALTGTGTLTAATYTLNGGTVGANLGIGALVSTGSVALNGTAAASTVDVTGGTLTLGSAERLNDLAALTIASGATLTLSGNETVGSALVNGTVNGVGTLLTGAIALNNSTVNTPLTANTLTSDGTSAVLADLVVNVSSTVNTGTLTVGNGATSGALNGPGTITVAAGATLAYNRSDTVTLGAVGGAGTLRQAGSGNLLLNGAVATSALQVTAGTVTLGAADRLADTSSLLVAGGSFNLGGFAETVGAVTMSGGSIANGTLTSLSSYSLSGGSVAATLAGSVGANVSGTVDVTGSLGYTGTTDVVNATLNFNNATPTTLASLTMSNTTLAGTGSVTVTGALDFNGNNVALQGAGTLQTQGATTVNLSQAGGSVFLGGKTWINSGTLDIPGDDIVQVGAGGVLSNAASGVINLTSSTSNSVFLSAVSASFSNAGTVNKAGAVADAIGPNGTFNNTGTVNVAAGTLTISSPTFVQAGRIDVASGATFASASLTNLAAGVISGGGALDIGSGTGTLTNQGIIRPGGAGTAGTLSIAGNVDLATGTLDLDLGGAGATSSSSDLLAVSGNVTLGGTVNAALIGGYTPVNADVIPIVTATGTGSGSFGTVNAPAGFSAGYNLAAGEAARLIFATSGTRVFSNAAGNLDWSTPANWGGALPGSGDSALISAGFAVLHAAGTDTVAALTVDATNALTVSGGSVTVLGATTLGGSLTASGSGAITLAGPLTGSGAVAATGGTLTLNGPSTMNSLLLTGGLLNGSGSLVVNNSFGRSGGASVGSGFSSVAITGSALQPGAWTAGSLAFSSTGALATEFLHVDAPLLASSGNVTLSSATDITFQAGVGSVTAAGDAVFNGANQVNIGGTVSAQRVQATSPNLVQITAGGITSTATSGDGIVLTGGVFRNFVGAGALTVAGTSRWLVYSGNPANDNVGGLAAAFRQYAAPAATVPLGSGNGLLYAIAPTLTATLQGSVSKVYDRSTAATLTAANYGVAGALAGDTVTLNNPATGSYDTAAAGSGKTVTASGIVATATDTVGGYPVYGYAFGGTAAGAVGTITGAPLAVTGTLAANKVYDATTTATLTSPGTVTPLAGDIVTLGGAASASFADKNVGSAKPVAVSGLALTGADAGNYTLVPPSGVFADITPRALVPSGLGGASKVYDATTAAPLAGTAAVTPLAGDLVALAGTGSGSFVDKNVGSGKPITVSGLTLTGADAANYALQAPAGLTGTITPAPLTVTGVTASSRVYDATTAAPLAGSATVTPLALDIVSVGGTASGSFADKNVGNAKPVTVSGLALAGTDAGNYTLVPPAGLSADITAAPLALAGVTAANKVYDTTTAAVASAALAGVLPGDTVTVGLTANFADANAGVGKVVSYAATTGGADAANYALAGAGGSTTASITPATLSYVATPLSLPAGQPIPALSGSVAGFLGADTLLSSTTGTLAWTTPATLASPMGSYAIVGGGLAAANYGFVQAAANATALTLLTPVIVDPATQATTVGIGASLALVQVAPMMSTPTENRVLDVTPALAPAAGGGDGAVFRAVNLSQMPRADVMTLLGARASYKKKVFANSLSKLEQDPSLATVQPCRSEAELATGACLITDQLKQAIQAARDARAAQATSADAPRARSERALKVRQAALPRIERKLALLIGLNEYRDKRVPQLVGAIPDTRAVRELLENRLGYETVALTNPTRDEIVRAFNKLALDAGADDSVIVYYAGHGEVVSAGGVDTGYWLPTDVDPDDPRTWLANSDIARMVTAVGSRQMVVSDSCYSGALVGNEKVQLGANADAGDMLLRRAAVVMSSGGNEPVADEGREGHSVFAWHFMRALEDVDKWQPGSSLYERLRSAVHRDFPQTPQYGASRAAGHQGNTDYLFERRELERASP